MRKRLANLAMTLGLCAPLLGWLPIDPPLGRIESKASGTPANGHLSDGCRLSINDNVISKIIGNAHKGGTDQADANTKISYWHVQIGMDRNKDYFIDDADIPCPMGYLRKPLSATATTVRVAGVTAFPASGTAQIEREKITYTGRGADSLTGVVRGVAGTVAVAHVRHQPITLCDNSYTTILMGNILAGTTTITVSTTANWPEWGFFKLASGELVLYEEKTDTSFKYCRRGYDNAWGGVAAGAASIGDTLTASVAWLYLRFDPPAVKGWENGQDDNGDAEGDIFQTSVTTWRGVLVSAFTLSKNWWMFRVYVLDVNGNSNQDVAAVNKMKLSGGGSYMGHDGDATKGVGDKEIVSVRVF